ncbi:MAG: hypothetical protein ACK4PR_12790, partial [Gammaproteobacteria bacterium]
SDPGIEYAVDCLNNLIAQQISPPTTLLKVMHGQKKTIYQASKTVKGIDLLYVLQKRPEFLTHLDQNNFSSLVILSLLLYPRDAKPDNFIYKFSKDNTKTTFIGKIIGIDNDHAFGDGLLRDDNGILTTLRNVLFFLPQMQDEVAPDFREKFLKLNPAIICMQWLKMLHDQNQRYQRLLDNKIFTEEEFSGSPTNKKQKSLNLPISLPKGVIERIYHNLSCMQRLLASCPGKVTHQMLFDIIEPSLARLYKEVAKEQNGQPLKALHKIWEPYFSQEIIDKVLTKEEKLAIPQVNDAETKNKISLAQAASDLLMAIDYSDFKERDIEMIFIHLDKELPFLSELVIRQCATLTPKHVLNWLSHLQIDSLVLTGQLDWQAEHIINICQMRPKLRVTLMQESGKIPLTPTQWAKLMTLNYRINIKIDDELFSLRLLPERLLEIMIEKKIQHEVLFKFLISQIEHTKLLSLKADLFLKAQRNGCDDFVRFLNQPSNEETSLKQQSSSNSTWSPGQWRQQPNNTAILNENDTSDKKSFAKK